MGELKNSAAVAIVALVATAACSEGGGKTRVTAEGGALVESSDGRMSISIPPNAIDEDTTVELKRLPMQNASAQLQSATHKDFAYELEPALQLDRPANVEMKLSFEEADTRMQGAEVVAPVLKLATEAPDGTVKPLAGAMPEGVDTDVQPGMTVQGQSSEVSLQGPAMSLDKLVAQKPDAQMTAQPPPMMVEPATSLQLPTSMEATSRSDQPVEVQSLQIEAPEGGLEVQTASGGFAQQTTRTTTDINPEFTGGPLSSSMPLQADPVPAFRCLGGDDLPLQVIWNRRVPSACPADCGGGATADGGSSDAAVSISDGGGAPSICGDGLCDTTTGEVDGCPRDCLCGDAVCNTCGDGVCNQELVRETAETCPDDCGTSDPVDAGAGADGPSSGDTSAVFPVRFEVRVSCAAAGGRDASIVADSGNGIDDAGSDTRDGGAAADGGSAADGGMSADAGSASCGDEICELAQGENGETCPIDCFCGDGVCDTFTGEDDGVCPSDCSGSTDAGTFDAGTSDAGAPADSGTDTDAAATDAGASADAGP